MRGELGVLVAGHAVELQRNELLGEAAGLGTALQGLALGFIALLQGIEALLLGGDEVVLGGFSGVLGGGDLLLLLGAELLIGRSMMAQDKPSDHGGEDRRGEHEQGDLAAEQ